MTDAKQPPRNGLYLEDKIKIIDWLRKMGQSGIDQAKLTKSDITAKAAELVKKPVTGPNVKTILASVKLIPYANQSTRERGKFLTQFNALISRVEELEAACKTAGIWPV